MSHVVFFLHGFDGRPKEFKQMVRIFDAKFGERMKLHACTSFHGQTHHGGGAGARLVAAEMQQTMHEHRCDRVSVVCHSFGGIVMAWALKLLDDSGTFSGVRLVNYVACATPFLGIRGSMGGQMLGGLIKMWCTSTREMCLSDENFEGSRMPFLRRVAEPDVLMVLGRFRRRALYACVQGDLQVGYESASMSSIACDARSLKLSAEWPHISAESAHGGRDHRPNASEHGSTSPPAPRHASSLSFLWSRSDSASPSSSSASPTGGKASESQWLARDVKREIIREILSGYRTLSWERADCLFGYATLGDLLAAPFAHEQIVGKVLGGMMEDSRGKDVLDHLVTRFEVADGGEGTTMLI